MERKPLLLELTERNPRRESQIDFEFPTTISSSFAVPNDVVFCGKVIVGRETKPGEKNKKQFIPKSESFSSQFDRWRRTESHSRSRKHYRNGLFGIVKFPLQMELSDIKMRQQRSKPLLKPDVEGGGGSVRCGGGESCWEMVRPLKRRNRLMNALAKATFGCIPVV